MRTMAWFLNGQEAGIAHNISGYVFPAQASPKGTPNEFWR
jgi:hypothetical protein